MSGFALNLDLTVYFEDLRKYSSIFVDLSKCKLVGDVENHIKSVFKLEDNICLTNKKFLIPRSEDIKILQQYETFKVQKCDFFDYQIHKNKGLSQSSDQPALNLIQSERTIDLSCRPKQRLKINICQNHCVRGAPSVENCKFLNNPIPRTSSDATLFQTKEKNKKKKRYLTSSDIDVNEVDEHGNDILDMSVSNARRMSYENCFTPETISDNAEPNSNQQFVENKTHFDTNLEHFNESQKKHRKRKKPTHCLEDLPNHCESLETENDNTKIDKKPNKKSSKCNTEYNNETITDLSFNTGYEERHFQSTSNNTEDHVPSKKHKHKHKHNKIKTSFTESTTDLGYGNENVIDDSSSNIQSKSGSVSTNMLEIQKRMVKEKFDLILGGMSHSDMKSLGSIGQSNDLKVEYSSDCSKFNTDQNSSEEKSVTSHSEFVERKDKRKRIRKHNKKKKRERLQLSAVGPVLDRLNHTQPQTSSPTQSDIAKHVFFTDEDFVDEMKIPSSTPLSETVPQGALEKRYQIPSQEDCIKKEEDLPNKLWQVDLLKLASKESKPIVFRRDVPSISNNKKDQLFQQSNCVDHSVTSNATVESTHEFNHESNTTVSDLKYTSDEYSKCNGRNEIEEINEKNDKLSVTPICNIQNVIVTDYPVIDEVKKGDLILFKVLKLNENKEPVVSNTILAKVNNAAFSPGRISLQIMDGFEECELLSLSKISKNSEQLVIEISLTDLIEPRLFYP